MGLVGWCKDVMYLVSTGRTTDIGLQWGKACYPCSKFFVKVEGERFYCPPPFRRKVEGHCFWFSVGRGAWRVVRGAEFLVGTLSP